MQKAIRLSLTDSSSHLDSASQPAAERNSAAWAAAAVHRSERPFTSAAPDSEFDIFERRPSAPAGHSSSSVTPGSSRSASRPTSANSQHVAFLRPAQQSSQEGEEATLHKQLPPVVGALPAGSLSYAEHSRRADSISSFSTASSVSVRGHEAPFAQVQAGALEPCAKP